MSKSVATPRPPRTAPALAAALRSPPVPAAALNDDDADPAGDALLRAALRLFAEHGFAAARHAHWRGERAFFAADAERYRWWLAVTRTLDRTVAAELAGRCAQASAAAGLPDG